MLDLIDGVFDPAADNSPSDPIAAAEVETAAIEVLLASTDSLVAYRRRHRSDVEVDGRLVVARARRIEPAFTGRLDRTSRGACRRR